MNLVNTSVAVLLFLFCGANLVRENYGFAAIDFVLGVLNLVVANHEFAQKIVTYFSKDTH